MSLNPFTVQIPANYRCGENAYSTTLKVSHGTRISRFTAKLTADDLTETIINNQKYTTSLSSTSCKYLGMGGDGLAYNQCTYSHSLNLTSDTIQLKINVINNVDKCGLLGGTITFYYD